MKVFKTEEVKEVEPLTQEERQEIDSSDFSWVWAHLEERTVFDVPRMRHQWENVKRALQYSDQQAQEIDRLQQLLKENNISF